jgi:wyosine [tRNA(Phe)-imidazoG37] synthetase (radical SAM superfamily)
MYVFGPVPSRRLGRSLGINNIPPKVCTYSCVYCQLGRTSKKKVERRPFYLPEDILKEVIEKIDKAEELGQDVDYLTFVPDGEPTLDINLGKEIEILKSLGIKVAVITNSSLLWDEEVRKELEEADRVSLKVDAAEEEIWRQINRPCDSLNLELCLDGIIRFSQSYEGELDTETMLVENINDSERSVRAIAEILAQINPARAYLSVPIRPPAEIWVNSPSASSINRAYQIMSNKLEHVEYLMEYEGDEFAFTGDVEKDLLSITKVHPMREDAVRKLLEHSGVEWTIVQKLLAKGQLIEKEHKGMKFYLRRHDSPQPE